MNKTLVIQSAGKRMQCDAVDACLNSVRQWAKLHDCDYRFIGDEIFDRVPQWYMDKVGEKLPVATDYARLQLITEALEQDDYQRAIWFDADTLIYDQSMTLDWESSCAFGQEVWVQHKSGNERGLKAVRNVHNAVCAFSRGSATLPFLQEVILSIVRRIDPDHIAPQIVGPKLLNALHSIACFSLLPQVGAFSPEVLADLARKGGPALNLMLTGSTVIPASANLGFSVASRGRMAKAVSELLRNGRLENYRTND